LRHELEGTNAQIHSIIEDLEASNQQLKSANEEVLSSNEELQSMNQELQTSKEELQSTNEELTTLNDELQNRYAELSQTSSDLNNVLGDATFTVRTANHPFHEVFQTTAAEIEGQRLAHVRGGAWNLPALMEKRAEVRNAGLRLEVFAAHLLIMLTGLIEQWT
jgi:two-component system, chemotaxis family, CheB/CheR fusion protein